MGNKIKLKNWQKNVLRVIFGVALNTLLRLSFESSGAPHLGNLLATIAAGYFMGPVYGALLPVLSGGICAIFGLENLIYVLPAVAIGLLAGIMGKYEKFLDNLYHTVSALCLYGFTGGTILAIECGIVYHNIYLNTYTTGIVQLLASNNFPTPFRFFVAGVFLIYPDVTASVLIIWGLRYMRNPFRKKIERRKYLKRNPAGTMALVLLAASLCIFPENASASESISYIEEIYNAENGMAGGAANDLVQTDEGTMWVATYEGLYRFNGKKFELITDIPNVRSVMKLFIDDDQNMWIGNNGTGLVVTTQDRGTYYLDMETGLPSDSVRDIEQIDSTTYYVGTSQGVARVSLTDAGLQVEGIVDGLNYTNAIEIAPNGTVLMFDNSQIIYIVEGDEIVGQVDCDFTTIQSFKFDSDGRLYIGSSDGQIGIYDKRNGEYQLTKTLVAGEMTNINDLYFDDNGFIYVAAGNGIGYFDGDGDFNELHISGFDGNVQHIMKDYQGNLWFTSTRCGLLSLVQSQFTDIFSRCGVDSAVVNTEHEWQGLLYVGTDTGLLALDVENGASVSNELTELLASARVRCIQVDSAGSMWISDYSSGTYEVTEDGTIYTYNTDTEGYELSNKARITFEMSDGTVIISTNAGMAFVKDHEIVKQLVCGENFSDAYVMNFLERDDGTLLAGTDGDGVVVIKDYSIVNTINRAKGLPSSVILRIVEDPFADGAFVLTGCGLCYMDVDYNVSEVSNFPYYNNLDMYITATGKLFVSSTAGIYVMEYTNLMSGGDLNYTRIDMTSGLPSSITSNAWNYVDEEGNYYLACTTGLYAMNLSHYGVEVDEYKPVISAMTVDGSLTPVTNQSTITIPAGAEEITFTMEINNFTSADPYVRYYLSGVDENKHVCKASDLADVSYTSIPKGNYEFYVEVLMEDQQTVLARKVYTICKETEIYEQATFRIYFYVTMLIILITMISGISNIATYMTSNKQKNQYERVLTKLEREKAEALEKALREEERANKSKSDFLASMSHEIRTPINAILGMDTMILRETTQDSVKDYARDVQSASETLLALINDILDFSKIESGKMELVLGDYDLSSIINDLVNMVKPKMEAKGLELIVDVNPKIPASLYGDEVRIKQIALNVLNNAVKYTEQGHVTMKVDYEQADGGRIALKVNISDTGIGIKEEDLKKLFSPYERIEEGRNKKIEGTGLGMSITKSLLEMMNSQLVVESVYGEGSSFSFTILQQVRSVEPIGDFKERLKKAAGETEDIERFHAPDAKILLVDDVEMNLMVATELMKRIEVQITTASSGREAIALAKQNEYDLMLLDSMMPELSGEETLHIMKKECEINFQTPVIVLTANAIKGAREEYLAQGFDNYLSKPIETDKLEAMLECYLPSDKIIPVRPGEDYASKQARANAQAAGQAGAADAAGSAGAAEAKPQIAPEVILEKLGQIEGIEVERGMETAGGQDVYLVVCKNFYDTSEDRIRMLETHYREQDIKNYTIQVHALKSSARLIGAYDLSEQAWEMEQAGRAEDLELIESKTEGLIEDYRRLLLELADIYDAADEDESKPLLDAGELKNNLRDMGELLEAFDFDTAKELFESLADYRIPQEYKDICKRIKGRLAEVDRDGILEILKEV